MNRIPLEDRDFEQVLYRAMQARPEPARINQLAQRAMQRAATASPLARPIPPFVRARQLLSMATSAIVIGLALFVAYQTLVPATTTTQSTATSTWQSVAAQMASTIQNSEMSPVAELEFAAVVLLLLVVHFTVFGGDRWTVPSGNTAIDS